MTLLDRCRALAAAALSVSIVAGFCGARATGAGGVPPMPITINWVGDIALSSQRGLPPGGLLHALSAVRGPLRNAELTLGASVSSPPEPARQSGLIRLRAGSGPPARSGDLAAGRHSSSGRTVARRLAHRQRAPQVDQLDEGPPHLGQARRTCRASRP